MADTIDAPDAHTNTDELALLAESERQPTESASAIAEALQGDCSEEASAGSDHDDAIEQQEMSPSWRGSGNRTPTEVATAFYALIEQGLGSREAASQVGIHLRTAQRLLRSYDADYEALQDVTRKMLAIEALDRVDDWRTAARVGAAKRGNHLPAKDWLLHAGIIEPLQGEQQGHIRIAINIGTEERPMKIVSPLAQPEEE